MAKRRTVISAIADQVGRAFPVRPVFGSYYYRLETRLKDYITVGRGPVFFCEVVATHSTITVRVKRENALMVLGDLRIILPAGLFGKPRAQVVHMTVQTLVTFTIQIPTQPDRKARVRKLWEQATGLIERDALRSRP